MGLIRFLAGLLGAFTGVAVPLLTGAFALAPVVCRAGICGGGEGPILLAVPVEGTAFKGANWRPWIDDPAGDRPLGEEAVCPARSDAMLPILADAPLPASFNPAAYRESLFACVLVGRDGRALAVRLSGTTGRRRIDSSLVATIAEGWRFVSASPRPLWVRVRLNSGPLPLTESLPWSLDWHPNLDRAPL